MAKKPTCTCLQEAATYECDDLDFFYDNVTDVLSIECCIFNETSERQEDVELEWNYCPQCGAEYVKV